MTRKKPMFGATGDYPRGKLNEDDEGGLTMGVASDDKGNVHLDFGKPVAWFALPAADAINLALLLLYHAGVRRVSIDGQEFRRDEH